MRRTSRFIIYAAIPIILLAGTATAVRANGHHHHQQSPAATISNTSGLPAATTNNAPGLSAVHQRNKKMPYDSGTYSTGFDCTAAGRDGFSIC